MENILTPKEVIITQMALNAIIEDLTATAGSTQIPLTPDARRDIKDMLENAKSALGKIEKSSGHAVGLAEYKEGDEAEFFTKES